MIRAYDEYGNVIELAEWEKQIRTEVIDECLRITTFYKDEWDGIYHAIEELEQLKEGVK